MPQYTPTAERLAYNGPALDVVDLTNDIEAAISRCVANDQLPETIIAHPRVANIRRVKGTARDRKRARFHNRKRVQFFASKGLELRIVPWD